MRLIPGVSRFACVLLFAFAINVQSQPQEVSDRDFLAIKTLLVKEYPQISASPGAKASSYTPSIGTPGCENDPENRSSVSVAWVGIAAASPEEMQEQLKNQIPKITCGKPVASIYFEPFREEGSRKDGALVNCTAPVQDPDLEDSPIQWECKPPVFRQYVQLEDQNCDVTLVGDMSDAGLMAVKRIGIEAKRTEPIDARVALLKFATFGSERWFAVFGSADCSAGTGSFFYKLEAGGDPALIQSWALSESPDD